MRLRADFWVAAFLRRCDVESIVAVLRRRGSSEAGAVYIKLDRLDGRAAVFGPAPQTEAAAEETRAFIRIHKEEWVDPADAEARLKREVSFDSDIWIIEVESRDGTIAVDIVS